MRWDDVQYFIEVAERGSVAAAARQLGVNHSTVLRHLGGLERSLACRLFDRLPSGYVLTREGHEFARAVVGISDRLGEARRRVAGIDTELRGHIRVTVPESLGPLLVAPVMCEFVATHPQITFDLIIDNAPLRLVQREADIALRGANDPPGTLIGRRVGTARTALYAAQAYIDDCARTEAPVESRWVGLDDSLGTLDSVRWVKENVPACNLVLRTNSFASLAGAVDAGLGVGWLPTPIGQARPSLVPIRAAEPSFDTALWVLSHPDLRSVARVASFARYLAERLQMHPALR